MADHPDKQVGDRDQDVAWFSKDPPSLSKGTRELLEQYSKIPSAEVEAHCLRIREEAWEIFPYPCVGQWRFLDLSIGLHPAYPEVISRLKSGDQKYLDLGCCFGQDIRRLVYDGTPSENCYGSDLRLDFMQMGYKFFLDEKTLKSTFIAGDVFDDESDLKQLEGRIDIIHAASFFHLFDLEQQRQVARRVMRLLKPKKDSMILGRQVGNVKAGIFQHRTNPTSTMFRHDADSWKKLWSEVGEETGTSWDCWVATHEWPGAAPSMPSWQNDGAKRLEFVVRRVE